MLYKCANTSCSVPFRYLGRGKLFQIESEYIEAQQFGQTSRMRRSRSLRRIERYWLCDECAATLTLAFDPTHGIATIPRPDAPKQRILASLRLRELGAGAGVEHRMGQMPAGARGL